MVYHPLMFPSLLCRLLQLHLSLHHQWWCHSVLCQSSLWHHSSRALQEESQPRRLHQWSLRNMSSGPPFSFLHGNWVLSGCFLSTYPRLETPKTSYTFEHPRWEDWAWLEASFVRCGLRPSRRRWLPCRLHSFGQRQGGWGFHGSRRPGLFQSLGWILHRWIAWTQSVSVGKKVSSLFSIELLQVYWFYCHGLTS